jgi:methyl-accepting chemotaxis protein
MSSISFLLSDVAFSNSLADTQDSTKGFVERLGGVIDHDPIVVIGVRIDNVLDRFEKVRDRIDHVVDRIENASDPIDNASDPIDNMSDPIDNMSDRIDNVSDPIDKMSDPIDKMSDRIDNMSDQIDNARNPRITSRMRKASIAKLIFELTPMRTA